MLTSTQEFLISYRHRRKPTPCDCCGILINSKERYSRTAFIFESKAESYNICENCQEIIIEDWYWFRELSVEDIFSEVNCILGKRHDEDMLNCAADAAYEQYMFNRTEANSINAENRGLS